jgi:hypothetical protein
MNAQSAGLRHIVSHDTSGRPPRGLTSGESARRLREQ